MYYAVRCCCQPNKIHGYLDLPGVGSRSFVVRQRDGSTAEIALRRVGESHVVGGVLTVVTEHAIYSDDRPLSFWQALPSFTTKRPAPGLYAPSHVRVVD